MVHKSLLLADHSVTDILVYRRGGGGVGDEKTIITMGPVLIISGKGIELMGGEEVKCEYLITFILKWLRQKPYLGNRD